MSNTSGQGVLEAMHRDWTVRCYRSRTKPLYTVVRSIRSLAAARHADCGWLCMDQMLVLRLGICRHVYGPKRVEWTNSASPLQALRAGLLHAMLTTAGSCFPWTPSRVLSLGFGELSQVPRENDVLTLVQEQPWRRDKHCACHL